MVGINPDEIESTALHPVAMQLAGGTLTPVRFARPAFTQLSGRARLGELAVDLERLRRRPMPRELAARASAI